MCDGNQTKTKKKIKASVDFDLLFKCTIYGVYNRVRNAGNGHYPYSMIRNG